jgi:uncharacterized protein
MKALHAVAFILVAVGAINWGLVGAGGWNVVEMILGTGMLTKLVYILVGLSAVYLLISHKKDCKCCEAKAEQPKM